MGDFLKVIEVNVKEVMIQVLQGSVVTETILGGLSLHLLIANFLWCMSAKNYANWLTVEKVIVVIKMVTTI